MRRYNRFLQNVMISCQTVPVGICYVGKKTRWKLC